MIDPDMRNAIYQLHLAGMPLREISRQFHVSRAHGADDHPPAGRHAPDGAERQDPHRPGAAAAAVPAMRRLAAAGPREAGGGGRRSRSAIPP